MRWLARLVKAIAFGILGLLVLLALWALVPAGTAPLEGERAIAALERVSLGGVEQTILVRGHDRTKPVLLFVHGGPGFGQLPIAAGYSDQLGRHFVVVHWDQRGAGASCAGTDFAAITREQIVADAIELSEQLARRFGGGGKIFLLGHSWGSVVGALAAQQRPELFHAYVGLGQVVNGRRNEELSLQFVRDEARRRADREALAELERIQPPYRTPEELFTQRRWLNAYRGSIYATERARARCCPPCSSAASTRSRRASATRPASSARSIGSGTGSTASTRSRRSRGSRCRSTCSPGATTGTRPSR